MCSTSGNRSFPVNLSFTPDADLYTSVKEVFSIEFQWTNRTTPPVFTNSQKGILDEGGIGKGSVSTIRWRGLTYTLQQVQLSTPTHSGWIFDSVKRPKNKCDMILLFKTTSTTASERYIFIVIPILEERTLSLEPAYLRALSKQNVAGNFSLLNCLPAPGTREYVYYTTCLEPSVKNALVLFFYQGCPVSKTTLDKIAADLGVTVNWPGVSVPSDILLAAPISITRDAFRAAVRVSALGEAESKAPAQFEDRGTESYKCVPLDPDSSVIDNKLQINVSTGDVRPLKEILAERDALRNAVAPKGIEPGQLENVLAASLGILLGLLLIGGGIYLYFYLTTDPGVAWPAWTGQTTGVILTAVLFSTCGILIGRFALP
jgi:hypothetical protein